MKRRGSVLLETGFYLLLAGALIWMVAGFGGRAIIQARQQRAVRELITIRNAVVSYEAVHGVWPDALLQIVGECPGGCPLQSVSGAPYCYEVNGTRAVVSVHVPQQPGFQVPGLAGIVPEGDGVRVSVVVTKGARQEF